MFDRLRVFSSKLSLDSSSILDRKQVLEFFSDQDIDEIVRKVNTSYENIAKDFIRVTKVIVTKAAEDRLLTVFVRQGGVSSAVLSKRKGTGRISNPNWSVSHYGRIFAGGSDFLHHRQWISFIDEYDTNNTTWNRVIFKYSILSIEYVHNACILEDRIMLSGQVSSEANRVELVKRNDDDGSLSSRLCKTPLPLNLNNLQLNGYSITSIQGVKVILAGGHTNGAKRISMATVFEGTLNEKK